MTPCVGNVVLSRRPQSTFYVSVRTLASLRYTYLGSFFLDLDDIKKLDVGAIWRSGNATGLFNPV